MNNLIALCLAIMIFAPSAAMAHGGDEHEEHPALTEHSGEGEHAASEQSESSGVVMEKTSEDMKIASGMRLAQEAVVALKYRATFAVIILLSLMALLAYKYPSARGA